MTAIYIVSLRGGSSFAIPCITHESCHNDTDYKLFVRVKYPNTSNRDPSRALALINIDELASSCTIFFLERRNQHDGIGWPSIANPILARIRVSNALPGKLRGKKTKGYGVTMTAEVKMPPNE